VSTTAPPAAALPPVRLPADQQWVTCTRYDDYMTSLARHIVRRGHLTTVCGASASVPDVWRPNTTKPRCTQCVTGFLREQGRKPRSNR
jgi:hypothetical protein